MHVIFKWAQPVIFNSRLARNFCNYVCSAMNHAIGLVSTPGYCICNLWWTKWRFDRFFSEHFGFLPCQYYPNSVPHSIIPLPLLLYILGNWRCR